MSFIRAGVPAASAYLLSLALVSAAAAAPTAGEKCETTKLKAAAGLTTCLTRTETKSITSGDPVDAAKVQGCNTKFADKMDTAETKAAGACPTDGDAAAIANEVSGCVERVGGAMSGVRFEDNGDGTVTDTQLGVIWQTQVAGTGCANCADEERSLADTPVWLGGLNGTAAASALAGFRDWGLPTIEELQGSLNCSPPPCQPASVLLGPNYSYPAFTTPYLVSGTLDFTFMPPCVKVIYLPDGTIDCIQASSALGRSRARIMNNSR